MFFTSLTPRTDIGGNCYLLELGDTRIVLDCGLHPKEVGNPALPQLGALGHDTVDAFFLSHAHLDHLGGMPVLLRNQPNAQAILSEPTKHVAAAMMHNSVHVMQNQRHELGIPEFPLFTHREVDRIVKRLRPQPVGRRIRIGDSGEVVCEMHHAGHVLGATGATFTYQDKTILYTGDILFDDQAIVQGAKLPTENIDTLIVETTHGATPSNPDHSRRAEALRMAEHIRECHDRGGAVLIPVFAFGKTQEVLTLIHQLKGEGQIPDMPVFIGGLSTKITGIFDRLANCANRDLKGFVILDEVDLTVASERSGNPLRYSPGSIFALSSGMLTERTVSNGFARHILNDPRNAILFVGYCDPDSPGGKIQASGTGGTVQLDGPSGPELEIQCEVERFNFSGHAQRDEILDYILQVDAKRTLLVHGDPEAKEWFADTLLEKLGPGRAVIPEPGVGLPIG